MKRKFKVGDYVILNTPGSGSKGVIIDGSEYPICPNIHRVRFYNTRNEFHYNEDILIHDTQRYREERLKKLLNEKEI